jgi:vitamin B12 transporter
MQRNSVFTQKKLLCGAIAALNLVSIQPVVADLKDNDAPVNYLAPSTALDTQVVTANRQAVPLREVAASISVLSAEEIAASGQSTAADVLRNLPGISVSGSGGIGKTTGLRIRGEEAYRTLVLIDGMNISDTTAPQVSPRFEDLMSGGIERIEVLRGPQGVMYGADAGGIVNITTRRAREPFAADAAVEYGRFDTRNLFANIRGKNNVADYSFSATHFDTDGFSARSDDNAPHDDDGYLNTTLHFNGGFNITDELRIEATIRNVRAENEYDVRGSTQRYINDYDLVAYRASIAYEIEWMLQTFAVQRSDNKREDFANGIGFGEYNGSIDEAQYKGIFRFTDIGDVVYGADLKEEELKQEGERRKERDQLGVYAEWQGEVADQFFYTAGLRHDDNDDFGEHTSYRVSAAYVFDLEGDSLKLKSSYGTGFRAPSLYEIAQNFNFWVAPPAFENPPEKEETSRGFDAGFEYRWHNDSYFEAVYFDQRIEDAIDYDPTTSGYLQDDGTTFSRGVELTGIYPVTKYFRLISNYTYNDTEKSNGEQRARRPRHIANLGLDFQPIDRVTVHANLRLVKGIKDDLYPTGQIKLDDYNSFSASINWAATNQLDLYIRGENLLDDDYQEANGYNTAKSAVYVGAKLHFR